MKSRNIEVKNIPQEQRCNIYVAATRNTEHQNESISNAQFERMHSDYGPFGLWTIRTMDQTQSGT